MILTLAASVASAIAALVMGMTYGLDITSNEDRFLRAAIEALKSTLRVMVPGAFLVDIIPMRAFRTDYEKHRTTQLTIHTVRYVPKWFPGAGFQTFAKVARVKSDLAVDGPLKYVKESMKVGLRNTLYQCRG